VAEDLQLNGQLEGFHDLTIENSESRVPIQILPLMLSVERKEARLACSVAPAPALEDLLGTYQQLRQVS